MKVAPHPCYILHHRAYRETSLLLEVFSRGYGRVTLIAKGVKGGKKTLGALMQPGQPLNIAWSIRKELGILTGVEQREGQHTLSGQMMMTVFYLNELLIRLLHKDEAHPELFDCYELTLKFLTIDKPEQSVLRIFEKQLLESLGYGLVLDHDAITGEAIEEEKEYYYQLEQGPVFQLPASGEYVKVSGRILAALRKENITELDRLPDAKHMMRFVLNSHLGPKPLASRALYKAYLDNTRPS